MTDKEIPRGVMGSINDTIDTRHKEQVLEEQYRLVNQQLKLREQYQRLREDLPSFIKQTFKTVSPGSDYHHNWHIDAIAEYLNACQRGEIKRLIINMPPRQLKSISTAIAWPAFLIGHKPSIQIMCGSYAASLAQKHSLDTQLVINSRWYGKTFPEVDLDPRQATKTKFATTARGQRYAISTGSAATGEGGDVLIVDDPTNPIQAMSDTERTNANEWFDQTLTSRLNDPNNGIIVVVMQRLHEEDLTGHLLEKGGWDHLCLQAQAERKTIIQVGDYKHIFEKDDYMDPYRMGETVLEQKKLDMSAYGYAGQYQQNPAPGEGGILQKKWWRKWPTKDGQNNPVPPPVCEYIIQTLDTAFGEKEENDYSVIQTWGLFRCKGLDGEVRMGCMLLDCESGHWAYPDLKAQAITSYRSHKPDKVVIENKASGQSLIQDLRRAGIPVTKFKVEKDKIFRANISSIVLEKGHVWYMDRDWANEVIKECAMFPRGKFDDKVDCATMAWIYLRKRFWLDLADDGTMDDMIPDSPPSGGRNYYGSRK